MKNEDFSNVDCSCKSFHPNLDHMGGAEKKERLALAKKDPCDMDKIRPYNFTLLNFSQVLLELNVGKRVVSMFHFRSSTDNYF